jgi:hypothetical protein
VALEEEHGGGGGGSSLEKTLTQKKIGGIPVWGFGVILAAAIVMFLYLRNKNSAGAANTPTGGLDPNAIDPATGLPYGADGGAGYGLPNGPIGDWLSQNPTGPQYPVGQGANGLPGPITNIQWSRLAFDYLVGKGDDPTLVGNALAKFLAGKVLSAAETSIVNLAETAFGAPPEGLIPINPGPDDPGTVNPPETPHPTPTVHPGFSLNVAAGEPVSQFTDQIRARLGFDPNWAMLEAVNPTLASNVNWGPSGSKDFNARTFKKSAAYYIPPL